MSNIEQNSIGNPITPEKKQTFPPLIEQISDWPINKLTEDRDTFVKELEDYTLQNLNRKSPDFIKELIQKTIFQEKIRMKEEPWRIDPPNDRIF